MLARELLIKELSTSCCLGRYQSGLSVHRVRAFIGSFARTWLFTLELKPSEPMVNYAVC